MTALILPGQEFEIEVEGLKFTVKALAGRAQIALFKAVLDAGKLEETDKRVESMEATEQILKVIFGDELGSEYWNESVDCEMTHQIARLVLNRGKVSEDEEKNLPSQHSSDAANCAKDAAETVPETSSA